MDWLAASIAIRVSGAVFFVFLRGWRKICTIRQLMESKGLPQKCLQDILVNCYESCTKLKVKKPTGSLVCGYLMCCVSPVQGKMANARIDISYLPSVDGETE